MKTTLILLTAVFSLSACAPRDPDVLTKNDHNAVRAKLPQKVELSVGVLAEGRVLQAQQILNLATNLASTRENMAAKDCIRSLLVSEKGGEKTYQISFNQCHSDNDTSEASFSSVSQLVMQLNEQNEIQSLQYVGAPISESEGNSGIIQVFKKNAKDNLLVKDTFYLSMTKSKTGYAFLGSSQTVLQSGYLESLTNTNLSIHMDGLVSATELLAWHSEILGSARNKNDGLSNPQVFSMVIDSDKVPTTCLYTLQFGKSVRRGLMALTDKDVTIIGKSDKSKKDDKVTVARQKPTSLNGVLPWDFWF